MLVLTRKLGERIWIGDDICIMIIETDRTRAKVAISAPDDVKIFREELLRQDDPRRDKYLPKE